MRRCNKYSHSAVSAAVVAAFAQAGVAAPVEGQDTTHAVLAAPAPVVAVAPVAVFAAPAQLLRCLCSATIEKEFIMNILCILIGILV